MSVELKFRDRVDAGRQLALRLTDYAGRRDVLVLGLPRGGVVVAHEVARALNAPLDVFIVRKLGTPGQEELAMGAIASGGVRVLNQDVIDSLGISNADIEKVAETELLELRRRDELYRRGRPMPDLRDKTVILVDDGLATGSTMRAAVSALRERAPRRLVAAAPVAEAETCAQMRQIVDEMVCAVTPEPLYAIGSWYEDFSQTSDEEVQDLLDSYR